MSDRTSKPTIADSTARRSEPSVNEDLAAVLDGKLSWSVTAQLVGSVQRGIPDIVVQERNRAVVAIEHEIHPASTVHRDAAARLGLTIGNHQITNVVELKTNVKYRHILTSEAAREFMQHDTDFQYAVLSGPNDTNFTRFPKSGYLRGSLNDLALFIREAGVPKELLLEATTILQECVRSGIECLREIVEHSSDTVEELALLLCQDFTLEPQEFGEKSLDQAFGIVATIILNALTFQQQLAGNNDIESLARLRSKGNLNQSGILLEWQKILKINYWSIFALAKWLLEAIRTPLLADRLVELAANGAERLAKLGLHDSHDLAGTVFQKFITDRKFLASYYTRPESATLLAHLALPTPLSATEYRNYRIADFACGTGTLIHAAYARVAVLHELCGGDSRKLHQHMIENNLVALDIVSSAAHLTASMLSSVYPDEQYRNTNVMIPQYGAATEEPISWNDVVLGSLELIRTESSFKPLFPSQVQYTQLSGTQAENVDLDVTLDRKSYQLVIMNPPYTRAAADWDRSERAIRQYRGLGTTQQVQYLMAERQRRLFQNTCFDGYAGLASAFPAIADAMLRDYGQLAFVLPFTCLSGASWHKFREMLRTKYGDVTVVSITRPNDHERAFSADTGMAECLVLATKGSANRKFTFLNLFARPSDSIHAAEFARAIRKLQVNGITDSPSGGTPLILGEEEFGTALQVESNELESFLPAGVQDLLIAQVMHRLGQGQLRLPRVSQTYTIPIARAGDIAQIGVNAGNIAGNKNSAFRRVPARNLGSFYPILWNRKAERDTSMLAEPDSEGLIHNESRAIDIWKRKSWAHFSANVRVNTQALMACLTEQESLGGSGWPNISFGDRLLEIAFVVWSNTTLGLMINWYFGPRQQAGRIRHGVETYSSVPILNVRQLGTAQLVEFQNTFDQFKRAQLLPMHLAYRDELRTALDQRVLIDCLGLPSTILEPLEVLRKRWCGEPTVFANRKDGILNE